MLPGDYDGATVWITAGTGAGQERTIASYTATTITVITHWDTVPDSSSLFAIADSTWQFGASSSASPVVFVVPNRDGTTIEISGRAANVLDVESDFELSPADPLADFRLGRIRTRLRRSRATHVRAVPTGQGTVEIQAIGFTSLTTRPP